MIKKLLYRAARLLGIGNQRGGIQSLISKLHKSTSILLVLGLLISFFAFSQPVQAALGSSLSLSRPYGPVGSSVTIYGSGTIGEKITSITFGGIATSPAPDYTLTSTSWSITCTVPPTTTGTKAVVVNSDAPSSAQTTFTVIPSILVTPASGKVGDTVTVYGQNFSFGDSIAIVFDSTTVIPAFSLSQTSFSRTFEIPATYSGTHSISYTGSYVYSDTASFAVQPNITVNKSSTGPGNNITVTGTGFANSESAVRVTFNGATVSSGITANTAGGWTSTFPVPELPGASYVIDAFGNSTASGTVPDLPFQVTPYFKLSSTSAIQGDTITVEGYGFKKDEENIILRFDSTDIGDSVQADSNGSWSTTFEVPAVAAGTHSIYARGSQTAQSSVPKVSLSLGADIAISKTSGTVSSVITVTGHGFTPNETGIILLFDNNEIPLSVQASDTGSWSASLTIPKLPGGQHTLSAKGSQTAATSVSKKTFTILPEVTLASGNIAAGDIVTLQATGFSGGESGIVINFDGQQIGNKITADTTGSWKADVVIPFTTAGQHSLMVAGSITNALAVGELAVDVIASITIDPVEGYVGDTVNISGSGYASNSTIKLYLNNAEITSASIITDINGSFRQTITIPAIKGGDVLIDAQDNRGNKAQAVFILDSTAPAIPELDSPRDGSAQGLFGNITPTLEWGKVTDQSGISYNLQVSDDPDFDNPVIDITGLTSNKYTLKTNDTLPRGLYYWRVQAVDGAFNSSAWSEAFTLKSGSISPVLFAILIVIGIAAIAAAIFFLLPLLRKKLQARKARTLPEIVVPEVVNAEYRQIEGEKKALPRAMPWKLALPQAQSRGQKGLSGEDQARLKVIVDFATSVPLVEPGANTSWLVELAENNSGICASPELYRQIVKGEVALKYEPTWMNHPTFVDLESLLQGQSLLEDIHGFVDSVNNTALAASTALQDIYQAILAEVDIDIITAEGWNYISAVYMDSFIWFQGKYLREPAERDYSIKSEPADDGSIKYNLYAESGVPFEGLLLSLEDEIVAAQMRSIHIKLRRFFRNNAHIKAVVSSIIQLEVQRNRLIGALSQFNRLNPA